MAKKKEISIEAIPVGFPTIIVEHEVEEPKKVVGKLDLSFPQEDLNKLVSKINEIVDAL